MLLVSANVNGIRAAARRGGIAWLEALAPDVVTLQEVRADGDQLRTVLAGTAFADWHVAHAPCAAKGRAGVAVLSRWEPLDVRHGLGGEEAHLLLLAGGARLAGVDVGRRDGDHRVAGRHVGLDPATRPDPEGVRAGRSAR